MALTANTRSHPLTLLAIVATTLLALLAATSAAAHSHQKRHAAHARSHVRRARASRAGVSISTVTPGSGATLTGTVSWQASVSGATPSRVDFAIDGVVGYSDSTSPYAFGGGLDTTTLANGSHTLTVTAYAKKARLASSAVTVNVQNPTLAPAPEEPAPAPEESAPVTEEPAPAPGPAPAPTAAPASIYWGAWIGKQLTGDQPPWDMTALAKFEEMTGKKLSILQFSAPFANCSSSPCTYYKFPVNEFNSIRSQGAIPFYSWASQSIPSTANEPNFQLSDVIAGTYDSYIREFATAAKNWGHPFFLRFNWEMNGHWFPWSEGVNGNKSGEYVTAWRHVHDIFTSVGATNVTWVWCPNVDPENIFLNLASQYPGDEYVDWSGLDGYNWGTNPANPDRWRSFSELFKSTYGKIVETIAPSKPMIIGEMASTEYGGSKASWIGDALSRIPAEYPKIRGVLWFEQYDSGMDWPIETSSSATEAFAAGIQNPAYATNTFGSLGGASAVQPATG